MLKKEIFEVISSSATIRKEVVKSLILPGLALRIDDSILQSSAISKIGGYPAINEGNWPFSNGKPLLFLAQISTSVLISLNNLFPKDGVLCFFISEEDVQNRYPDRQGEFRVIYTDGKEQCKCDRNVLILNEFSVSFFRFYSFPSDQEFMITEKSLTEEESFFIEEVEQDLYPLELEDYDIGHRLLGHPKAVQGTVRFWWAIKYFGFEDVGALSLLEKEMVEREGSKFILLLQLDFSDPKIGIDYLGGSVAYFGIHQFDLEHKKFDKVVLVMQNT